MEARRQRNADNLAQEIIIRALVEVGLITNIIPMRPN